ncbi:MAG: GBS Bsp-like repeat-containing protein [Ruminococcus sp.]|nr:GBS Bsp-like repeat-containing protein [Ruminococcus sp.]
MKKLLSKITAILSASAMALSMLGSLPAAASDGLEQYNIEITYDGQITDTFLGVDAKYTTYYEWSGVYSCAYFIGNFYEKFYGTLMYDINNYQGKPKVYLPGHTAELRPTNYPLPGDVVQTKTYSHVAIVKAVEGDTLTLIEQNWKWKDADGKVISTVNRKIGKNDYYVYRLYIDGVEKHIPYDKPTLDSAYAGSVTNTGYSVYAAGSDETGLTYFRFGTYPKSKGQAAIQWQTQYVSGKNATVGAVINTADFGDLNDTYVTVVEAYNKHGNKATKTIETFVDRQVPVISDVKITDVTADGYTVSCKVSDNVGIMRVCFPSWTTENSTDDIPYSWQSNLLTDSTFAGGSSSFTVKTKDHNGEYGEYNTTITVFDAVGNVGKKTVKVNVNPAASVKLNKEELNLKAGETAELTASLKGYNAGEITDKITWASSDAAVTVKDGKLTANSVGTADITVTTSTGKSAVCKVNVTKDVSELTFDKVKTQVYTGSELTPDVKTADGTKELVNGKDYTLTYSDNTKIGKATIKLTGENGYVGSKEFTFNIIPGAVKELNAAERSSDSISLSWGAADGAEGYIVYLKDENGLSELGRTTETSFNVKDLEAAKQYTFSVASFKKLPDGESLSAKRELTTATLPAQIVNVTAQRCGSCLSILWDRQSQVTGYEVRLTSADGEETILDAASLSVISCCFISGVDGERSITVRAYKQFDDERIEGEWSEAVIQ